MKYTSSVLAQASGSVGGTVYSRNKGGAYTRNRSKPTNPRTPAMVTVRNALKSSANAWGSATTASQRQDWVSFANLNPFPNSLGLMQRLSGIAMFNKVNVALINAFGVGAIQLDSPGAVTLLPVLTPGATLQLTGGVLTVDLLSQVDFVIGDQILGFITTPCSPGRTPVHQPYVALAPITLAAVPTVPTEYTGTSADPFAASRQTGSPYSLRYFWLRGANLSPNMFNQGVTA